MKTFWFPSLALLLVGCASTSSGSAARGRVAEGRFVSTALGVEKRYLVYLPAGYDASSARYPVVYLLHGLGGNERDWVDRGHLDATADRLGLRAIVVMPDGDASFYANSATPADYDDCMRGAKVFRRGEPPAEFCVKTGRYEDYLTHDLVAHVDATYRTVAERHARAIAGLSMGGFGALMLAMRHRDLFAAAASHSGVDALLFAGPHPYRAFQGAHAIVRDDVEHWGSDFGAIGAVVRGVFGTDPANWRAHDPAVLGAKLTDGELALYLDCGLQDNFSLQDGASYLHEVLTAAHVTHRFDLLDGKHDFRFWSARLPESLRFLGTVFTKGAGRKTGG